MTIAPMKAELLSIGTELLLGEIVDTNANYLAGRLALLGIDCLQMQTVGDNLGRAKQAFERALSRSDLIVATGGLGPTEDDLTREAIAAALGETPAVDPALEADLVRWFSGRGITMPERNRKQAWLIPSARALPNPNGTAPGWDVQKDGKRIIAMPGVPREMTPMWESVEPSLTRGGALRWRTLKLLGIGESAVEEKLAELVRSTSPTVATYAKNDGVHVRVADKAGTPEEADRRVAEMEKTIRARLGEYVWGTNDETLPIVIGRRLAEHGWRLALAESLSAGDIARAFADAPGAERWFAGAVVRPTADAETLDAEGKRLGGDVLLVTPHGVETSELRAILPGRTRRLDIRFRSIADGRRRALLSGLDLLRRALAD
ncbi:MAG TPA: CinA family nicotinamide mononucleotide deamidase-related protein [Candidatus Polarisedimenticolia bacterium]|nr:CinA family nicotinamide mononucleotide deamidase-related protein [Candidatus Polarisedimenticolia bacterium]